MIVGEGPGEQEDLQGRPFVGPAGNLLDLALVTAQLGRGHVFIANTVKCRPPGNRNPTKEEMDACFPFLKQQIETIQPDLIIALGKVAAEYLLDRQVKITKEHGELDFLPTGGCVMIVLHPAYVLRNQKDEVKQSFFDAFNGARQIVYGV
jgi:DNA polymerase